MGFSRGRYRVPSTLADAVPDLPGTRTIGRRTVCDLSDELLAWVRPSSTEPLPFVDKQQLAEHNTPDSLWIVIDDLVLDVTRFADVHPGGPEMLLQFGGTQCGWQFRAFHRPEVLESWRVLVVGHTEGVKNAFPERPKWIKTS